jgi:hypothetical protein
MSLRGNSIFRDPWAIRCIVLTTAIFVAVALIGLILLPLLQPNVKAAGLCDAIRSAAGIARKLTSTTPVTPDFQDFVRCRDT